MPYRPSMPDPVSDSPGVPTGWFAVARVADVRPGGVLSVRRFGEELVLFRTRMGTLALVEAACPHLGAHLGEGGRVVGESLVCPFHGFRFGADGACRGDGAGGSVGRGARLGTRVLAERAGVVFAWNAPDGRAPTWELPELESDGWPSHRLRQVAVDAHPRDTTENSVDLAHFTWVHGYDAPRIVSPLERDGHRLRIAFAATRRTGPLGTRIPFTFRVEAHGLGFSRVRVEVEGLATAELLVLASPVDARRSEVLLGARVRMEGAAAAVAPVRWLLGEVASSIMATILRHDVVQDARIWSHKLPIPRPRLSAADGPIGPYRAWAAQFDEGLSSTCARARQSA